MVSTSSAEATNSPGRRGPRRTYSKAGLRPYLKLLNQYLTQKLGRPWLNRDHLDGPTAGMPADEVSGGIRRDHGCINSVVPSTGTWLLVSTPPRAWRGLS